VENYSLRTSKPETQSSEKMKETILKTINMALRVAITVQAE